MQLEEVTLVILPIHSVKTNLHFRLTFASDLK